MALPPSAVDPIPVYSSFDEVQTYVPPSAIAGTADTTPGPGKVLRSRLTALIYRYSRMFDATAQAKGFETPFPDISATNPICPEPVVQQVTWAVVGEVRSISNFGNRKPGPAAQYPTLAAKAFAALLANPSSLGYGRVSCDGSHPPEPLTRNIIPNLWQLGNRNILVDSLRFVDRNGNQVFRPDGLMFATGLGDYGWHADNGPAEGLIWLWNESTILAAIGVGGGVVYDFSWHKLDWGQSHQTAIPGQRST